MSRKIKRKLAGVCMLAAVLGFAGFTWWQENTAPEGSFVLQNLVSPQFCLGLDEDSMYQLRYRACKEGAIVWSAPDVTLSSGTVLRPLHVLGGTEHEFKTNACLEGAPYPAKNGDKPKIGNKCDGALYSLISASDVYDQESYFPQDSLSGYCVHTQGDAALEGAKLVFWEGCVPDKQWAARTKKNAVVKKKLPLW